MENYITALAIFYLFASIVFAIFIVRIQKLYHRNKKRSWGFFVACFVFNVFTFPIALPMAMNSLLEYVRDDFKDSYYDE